LFRPRRETYPPDRRLALTSYLALLRKSSSDDLPTQLDYIIQRQLRSGPCTLQLMAEELRMHPRNLQQQLKSTGPSFSETLAAYRSRHRPSRRFAMRQDSSPTSSKV